MEPKQECERMIDAVLPFAKQMLRAHGEFYPFGAVLRPTGEIVDYGAEEPNTKHPRAITLIRLLEERFQNELKALQIVGCALVSDVRVVLPKSDIKSDAIQVSVEHADGFSADVFYPYKRSDRLIEFFEPFAQRRLNSVFTQRSMRSS